MMRSLAVERISYRQGAKQWLKDISTSFASGGLNVVLGRTGAGKSPLLRLLAGLEVPDSGIVTLDGTDVTRVPVRKRDVAMVYQEFVNYPSMTAWNNIATPLKLRGLPKAEIADRVAEAADQVKLTEMQLARLPGELSGGQQQRVAIARALAKRASVVLMDEPLANLDYKLREELRVEIAEIAEKTASVIVYATTEADEALSIADHLVVLHEGVLAQAGKPADLYWKPKSVEACRLLSDPPPNVLPAEFLGGAGQDASQIVVRAGDLAVRPTASHPDPHDGFALPGEIAMKEFTGGETLLHIETEVGTLVAMLPGVTHHQEGERVFCAAPLDAILRADTAGQIIEAHHG